MKRKYASRSDWKRVLEREYKQTYVEDDDFTGYISLIILKKVKEPLFVGVEGVEKYCVADCGYKWLQYFPKDEHYSLTTMFNAQNEVVQWYFDIAHKMTLSSDGEPCFDDLYLDVVVLPNGNCYLIDEDELQEALDNNVIGIDDYNLAKQAAKKLIHSIESRNNPLLFRCYEDLRKLEAL
jgi:uncharacterized protein